MITHGPKPFPKYAITSNPNIEKLKPTLFKYKVLSTKKKFPIIIKNKLYTYLGIQLEPSLEWEFQNDITIDLTNDD